MKTKALFAPISIYVKQ